MRERRFPVRAATPTSSRGEIALVRGQLVERQALSFPPSAEGAALERTRVALGLDQRQAARALRIKKDVLAELERGGAVFERVEDWALAERELRRFAGAL
jgi:hypothetical protein